VKSTFNFVAVLFLAASFITPAVAESAADLYKAKCVMCHGATGLGDAPAGKALKAASFKDPAIVKASDADLMAAVKNGKGKMPPYNGKLTDAQIKSVITYIRSLQK
jgi:mono/diheme cytochrome c family protein